MLYAIPILMVQAACSHVIPPVDISDVLKGAHWVTADHRQLKDVQAGLLRLSRVDPVALFPSVTEYVAYRDRPAGVTPEAVKREVYLRQVDICVLVMYLCDPILNVDPNDQGGDMMFFDTPFWTTTRKGSPILLPCHPDKVSVTIDEMNGAYQYWCAMGVADWVRRGKLKKSLYHGGFEKSLRVP